MGNKAKVLKEYDEEKRVYERFAEDVENLLIKFLENDNITYNATTHRLKSKDSLSNKIEVKNDKYETLSEITDIAGIRVISYYADDVDKIAEIVEKEFEVDQKNSIDKRKALEPDRFGYCSVHYVVKMKDERLKLQEYKAYKNLKCEIQIRSVLQHAWAEIEHDLGYKSEITIPRDIRRNFSRLAGLLEIADKEFEEIRTSLYTYKQTVQTQIKNNETDEQGIDAVVLDIFVNHNENIINLNKHIKDLTNFDFEDMNNHQEEITIKRLKWLKVTTVKQLNELCEKYYDTAIQVACEKFKGYKNRNEYGIVSTDIAFFYLCYAMLIKDHCNKEEIRSYLEYTNTGSISTREKLITELYNLGTKLNKK